MDGVIINADSMQVYSNLRIITARPTVEEEAQVPHMLYGHVDGASPYNPALWIADALAAIEHVQGRGQLPILVGGTGLYFKTLFEGISPIPDIPDEIRAKWRAIADEKQPEDLHALLWIDDPETASRLRPTDTQRITRALEVFEATGQGIAAWNRMPQQPFYDQSQAACFYLDADRDWLYPRINQRFDDMMAAGTLDEVRALIDLGLYPDQPILRAHGVPEFIAHLRGEMSYDDALTQAKANVRHYAKRQSTWWRGQMVGWVSLKAPSLRGA